MIGPLEHVPEGWTPTDAPRPEPILVRTLGYAISPSEVDLGFRFPAGASVRIVGTRAHVADDGSLRVRFVLEVLP